jgi:hypothetical protein
VTTAAISGTLAIVRTALERAELGVIGGAFAS